MRKTSTRRPGAASRRRGSLLDDQIGFLLRCAYQRASTNLAEKIGAHDLTAPQFATLARLRERGRLSQNLLGRLVAMEPANIRDVVQRLVRRGLLQTGPAEEDGRLILVGLTRKGQALTDRLLPMEADCTSRTLAPLKPSERRVLYGLLRRLIDAQRPPD